MHFPCFARYAALLGLLSGLTPSAFAQTAGVGTNAFTPDGSALLELRSTTQGVLAPRFTASRCGSIPQIRSRARWCTKPTVSRPGFGKTRAPPPRRTGGVPAMTWVPTWLRST